MGGRRYFFEHLLIVTSMLVSVLGFWSIYFGPEADPQPHHHLHVLTAFLWMGLLLFQLTLIARGRFAEHRRAGLAVLFVAPLLVATTAMLSVHSAHRGVTSGEGDFLIVQNVMGTIELALLIFLAFLFKRRRKLHAAFLLSTTILFLGIALFFALLSFAPPFRIEGPETFHRFQMAAMTGQAVSLGVGLLFFIRDYRNGWPFLLAASFFALNDLIRALLASQELLDPLTSLVGSLSQPTVFLVAFLIMLLLLVATALPTRSPLRTN